MTHGIVLSIPGTGIPGIGTGDGGLITVGHPGIGTIGGTIPGGDITHPGAGDIPVTVPPMPIARAAGLPDGEATLTGLPVTMPTAEAALLQAYVPRVPIARAWETTEYLPHRAHPETSVPAGRAGLL